MPILVTALVPEVVDRASCVPCWAADVATGAAAFAVTVAPLAEKLEARAPEAYAAGAAA